MTCEKCGGKTGVVYTSKETDCTVRRLMCSACKHRFYTVEIDQGLYERLIRLRGDKHAER